MNQITNRIQIGTIGELLVQIRLLQYGVQAAPPIKDSGNDLIAVKGAAFRAVSVRTTTSGRFRKPARARSYHLLAVVHLNGADRNVFLDSSLVYLIPKNDVAAAASCKRLERYLMSAELVQKLFGNN